MVVFSRFCTVNTARLDLQAISDYSSDEIIHLPRRIVDQAMIQFVRRTEVFFLSASSFDG